MSKHLLSSGSAIFESSESVIPFEISIAEFKKQAHSYRHFQLYGPLSQELYWSPAQMRMTFKGDIGLDLLELSKAFWSKRS